MSHLIESYALQTGARISKPFIIKNFFPTPEKYITIHNSSGMEGKSYDYFQDVVDEIIDELDEQGIKIVQIGTKDDAPLDGCLHLQGQTNVHQTSFIIGNALLHIGNDSFPVHLASAANTPIVALYSITTPDIAGPYFSKNHICLSPDYGEGKPSFNPQESPKTVNTIQIEEVIGAIFKQLNIVPKQEVGSLFLGNRYKDKVVEFIPDSIIRPDFVPNLILNMRLDMMDDGDTINENTALFNIKQRKFAICMTTSKRINNVEVLAALKENIVEIFIDITKEKPDIEYITKLVSLGLRPRMVYRGKDEDYFNTAKMDLLELGLHFIHKKHNEKEIDKLIKLFNNEHAWIKTNRIVLANNKVYLSEAHMKAKIPTISKFLKLEKGTLDLDTLAKEADFVFVYSNQPK